MKTYKIIETAGYKGCGEAFAEIVRGDVISLNYIDDIVAYDDWANVADDENPYLLPSGIDKVNAFIEIQRDNGRKLVKGMCSCWQFCVS